MLFGVTENKAESNLLTFLSLRHLSSFIPELSQKRVINNIVADKKLLDLAVNTDSFYGTNTCLENTSKKTSLCHFSLGI